MKRLSTSDHRLYCLRTIRDVSHTQVIYGRSVASVAVTSFFLVLKRPSQKSAVEKLVTHRQVPANGLMQRLNRRKRWRKSILPHA